MSTKMKLNRFVTLLPKDCCGVYYCYNAKNEIIYIGKSVNIRKRIQQHFLSKEAKEIKLQQLTEEIRFENTGSELIALLRESEHIKKYKPLLNRALRRTSNFYALYTQLTTEGYLALQIQKTDTLREHVTSFSSLQEAKNVLHVITERHQLCQKINGLYASKKQCFQYTIKTCNGACINLEAPAAYNARVEHFLSLHTLPKSEILFELPGRKLGEKGLVLIQNGVYIGFGYCPSELTDKTQIKMHIQPKEDNRDARRIVFQHLRKAPGLY